MNRGIKRIFCTAPVVLAALGLAVGPAGAASPAAGTSLGEFNDFQATNVSPLAPLPQCAVNDQAATLTLGNVAAVGTMAGATGPNTTATIKIPRRTMYFNPVGTFQDAMCSVPAFGPTGLSASITVKVGATTLCSGTAQYGRAGEVGLVLATCGAYTLVFEGAQQPCFPDAPFPVDPCDPPSREWIGTWEQV